jgi:uncharacterized protein
MALTFEWDTGKAALNVKKHGVSFEEAKTVFHDPLEKTRSDQRHSVQSEERWVTVGRSLDGRILVVVHSEQQDAIRIISARRATRTEREQYEEESE